MDESERRPVSDAWVRIESPSARFALERSAWRRRNLHVISDLTIAEMPDGKGTGPQWHVSVAVIGGGGRRANEAEATMVRRAFGMVDAEEDNHEPGKARHFWLTVDPSRRVDCECKADEVTVVEADGHTWQAPPAEIERRRAEMRSVWGKS